MSGAGVLSRFCALRPREAGVELVVRAGTIRDYDRLAWCHYRGGRPATVVRVLVLESADGESAGVLVVSMPTLNGRWREAAWPGRFSSGDRRRDAARLNAEVRTISRVVIEPRWRGQGLAARLVRAYLERPLTPATEAVAAMGLCAPFFARAGMRGHVLGPSGRDRRLLAELREARVRPVELLGMREAALPRGIAEALDRWGNASRTTRHLRGDVAALARRAGMALLARPIAYTHDARDGGARGDLRGLHDTDELTPV